MEPYKGNEAALGFDLASDTTRLTALVLSRETGQPRATAGITLVQEKSNRFGFLIFVPLYEGMPETPAERYTSLRGFVLGVILIEDLFEEAIHYTHSENVEIDFWLYDETEPAQEQLLYFRKSRLGHIADNRIEYRTSFEVAGRQWGFIGRPTVAYVAAYLTLVPYASMATGLLLTMLLTGYLWQRLSELKTSKRQTEVIVESVASAIISINEHGIVESFNTAAKKIFGCHAGEVIGKNVSMLMPEPHRSRHDNYIRSYLKTGKPKIIGIGGEVEGQRKGGSRFPMELAVSEMPSGKERKFVGVLTDITQRRLTESDLRKLSKAIEQTADSVVITNKQGVIEYVNPAFGKTTGYSRDESLGHTPQILKSGKHDTAFYKNLWNTITNGQPYRGTIINKKKNGELYWAEQTITPMKDDDGNINNFVSVLKDITELKKQHKQEFFLGIAREVQQRLYPETVSVPGFDIAGVTYPAVETGGDYFDFILMPDGSLWIAVGDVTGHGFAAALIMAQTRAFLRAFAKMETDPALILSRLNQELVTDLQEEHFVTLILARLDPRERSLVYASAGHVPGYLLNRSGEIDYVMESTGVPLGFIQDYEIDKSEPIKLAPGNIAVFLTDGIMEFPDEKEFGFDRAHDVIKCHRQDTAQHIAEFLCQEVRSFSENQPQEDDITSVICKVNPFG
jgi:PAS domain S-box-containing protein